jgi:hypothetical protein
MKKWGIPSVGPWLFQMVSSDKLELAGPQKVVINVAVIKKIIDKTSDDNICQHFQANYSNAIWRILLM